MIRRILMAVAAIAMSAGTVVAAGVVGTGVAGAAGSPSPTVTTCPETGTVTFAKPGLSSGGSLTAASSVKTVASVTPAGTGCSGTPIAATIASATTPCAQSGGVPTPNPPSSNPSACFQSKTSKGVTTYGIAKDPNYYDTSGSFESSGLSDLQTALQAKPLKTTVDGVGITLSFGTASEVGCTGGAGFDLQGNATVKGATVATYDDLVCLTSDSGPGTTGNFVADVATGTGTIATATIAGNSALTVTWPNSSCDTSGTVTFPKPGLSANGSLTAALTVKTVASTTATGTGCSGSPVALTISAATTPCEQSGGVPTPNPPSSNPPACFGSKTSKGVTTYNIAKDPNYYDTSGDFINNGLSDLEAAWQAKPPKGVIDGLTLTLAFGSASQILPGGSCGSSGAGFDIQGNGQIKGANVATFDDLVCIVGDSGPGTTGNFIADFTSSTATIATATLGSPGVLNVTFNP